MDFWTIVSMLFVLVALGLFAWLGVERMRYYKSGEQERKLTIMLIASGCIVALLFAAGVHSFKNGIK